MFAGHSLGFRENIFNKSCGNDAQPNLAIDSAKSKVVNLISKGRDVRTLCRVHVNGEHIFSAEINVRRQIERKRRVAALVLTELHTVNPNRRGCHHTFKVNENTLAARLGGQTKSPPVNRDKLILLIVKAMPRQSNIRVRNSDSVKCRVIELPCVSAFDKCMVVAPIPVDGKKQPPTSIGSCGRGIARK